MIETTSPAADLVGVGIYTVADAARLTKVPGDSIRRWLWGTSKTEPLWEPQIGRLQDGCYLGFQDLTELRFVRELRELGHSTYQVRRIIEALRDRFGPYPFSSRAFRSDRRALYVKELEQIEDPSFDVETGQTLFDFRFDELIEVFDYSETGNQIERWWPLGRDKGIVIDPERSLGRPIVGSAGVPTEILARAVAAEGSVAKVAELYELGEGEVEAAMEMERSLAA